MTTRSTRLAPLFLALASACQPGSSGTDAGILPGTDAPIAPGTDAPIAPGTDAPATPTGPTLVSLAAGEHTTCAVLDDGTARCWGDNRAGQLGDGTLTSSVTPVEVAGVTDAIAIATSYELSCVLHEGGTVSCWGSGSNGRLGNGANDSSPVPVEVTGLTNVVEIGAGFSTACALRDDGTVACWGRGGNYGSDVFSDTNVPVDVPGLTGVEHLSTASHGGTSLTSRTCGVRGDGSAFCWGLNADGQHGDGTQNDSRTPVEIPGLDDVTAIAAALTHTCIVRDDGTYCMGTAPLGDGGVDRQFVPTLVTTSAVFESLSVGWEHACGLTAGGDVWCWGRNGSGQIGDGEELVIGDVRSVPVEADVSGIVLLAAGATHTCAHDGDGVTWCWGRNEYGETGSGEPSSLNRSNVPTPVVW
jgi:alpha-tubulin suppressor-like RCC1 family protein